MYEGRTKDRTEKTPISADGPEGKPKISIRIPPERGKEWWVELATIGLTEFIQREGAAVWPTIEYALAETRWIHDFIDPDFPVEWHPDPHHLTAAKATLVPSVIYPEAVELGGRRVTAFLDARAIDSRGQQTAVSTKAASVRRLYRRLLFWTGRPKLCGTVAERVVDATLRSLAGTYLWIPPDTRPGLVNTLVGRPVIGGPLDAAGEWVHDPHHITAGSTRFAVEVKNIRETIYPWDLETWDLLAKVGDFPEVVPVLVARRIHYTTFRFFKDIGALGTATRGQWFSTSIDPDDFRRVGSGLRIPDLQQVPDDVPTASLTKFFRETGPKVSPQQIVRWQEAAPIVQRFRDLRNPRLDYDQRRRLWAAFGSEIERAGLYEMGQWGPREFETEETDFEMDDW